MSNSIDDFIQKGSPVADRFVRRQVDLDGDAITVDADDFSVRYGSPYNPYPNSNGI